MTVSETKPADQIARSRTQQLALKSPFHFRNDHRRHDRDQNEHDHQLDEREPGCSIGDHRAATLVSMILEEAAFEVQHPESGIPGRVALWVAEPSEQVLAAARDGMGHRLVLFGSPPEGATPADVIVIDRPHDFQAIRLAVGSAVTAIAKRKDHEVQTDSSPVRR